jgi:hypothetical protein
MDILYSLFDDKISKIIISKINYECIFKCMFDNCNKESLTLNKYCNKHWCLDGHSTNQKKYRGYCSNCFDKIMKNDKKKYLNLVTKNI